MGLLVEDTLHSLAQLIHLSQLEVQKVDFIQVALQPASVSAIGIFV